MGLCLVDSTLEHHQGSLHPHPPRLHHPIISHPSLSSTLHQDGSLSRSTSPLLKYSVVFPRAHQPWLSRLRSFTRILIVPLPPWPPLLLGDVQALLAQPTQLPTAPTSIGFPIAFSLSLLLLLVAIEPFLLLKAHVQLVPVLAFVFRVLLAKLVVHLIWKPFLLFSSSFSFSSQLEVVANSPELLQQ